MHLSARHMKALINAIETFYSKFGDVAKPLQIYGCPCCINDKEIAKLLASDIRAIQPDDLVSYASSAFLTVGDVADYLYFLPRILEISIREEFWWPDIEVTARAIQSTNLNLWPSDKLQALDVLVNAAIEHFVDSGSHRRIDGWLCAIARMGLDLHPGLQKIQTNADATLAYFQCNADCLLQNRLCNAFWELPNVGHDAIVRWFKSDAVQAVTFEAYG